MGHENKNKELRTDAAKITGSMKNMYYFLVGVSVVVPVLSMLKLLYLDVMTTDGAVASHSQYYLWNSFKLLHQVRVQTADGVFFMLMCIIPLVMLVVGIVRCIISLVKAFTVKMSWKHAEQCVGAFTTMIVATVLGWVIFTITGPFFEQKAGFGVQNLEMNITIYVIFAISVVGRIVSEIYFKKIRENHLF